LESSAIWIAEESTRTFKKLEINTKVLVEFRECIRGEIYMLDSKTGKNRI